MRWLFVASLALSLAVVTANDPPQLLAVSMAYTAPARVGRVFTCRVDSFVDNEGDPVSATFLWLRNGDPFQGAGTPNPINSNQLTASTANGWAKGDTIRCTVSLTDSSNNLSNFLSTSLITLVNTPPQISSVLISPTSPRRNDFINCTVPFSNIIDPDDIFGPFRLKYAWRNGPIIPGETKSWLLPGNYVRGDYITCEVTPNDFTADGLMVSSAAVQIANTPPVLSGVTLSPSTGVTATTALTCVLGATTDVDGDLAFTYTYRWYADNDRIGGQFTATLAPSTLRRGRAIKCSARPSDASLAGKTVNSTAIVVVNSVPQIQNVLLVPARPTRSQDTVCVPGTVYDADVADTAFTFRYVWTVNGITVNVSSNTLSSTFYKKNDVISCSIAANDGLVWGPFSPANTTTVANSPPIVGPFALTLDSWALPTVLSCVPASVTDPDVGDTVLAASYTYRWWRDGGVVVGQTAQQFAAFARPNVVACEITVYDSSNAPAVRLSSNLLIDSPTISASVASDPNNRDLIYNVADAITVQWGAPTDMGGFAVNQVLNKSVVDAALAFSQSLGNDYQGVWTDDHTLVVTALDVRSSGNPQVGVLTVQARATGRIRNAAQTSLYAAQWAVSPPLTGSFGTASAAFVLGPVAVAPVAPSVDNLGNLASGVWAARSFGASAFGNAAVSTACGGKRHLLLVANSRAYGAGSNAQGQLGFSGAVTGGIANYATHTTVPTFTVVDTLPTNIVSVACGAAHSLAIDSAGAVYTTGLTANGQLGYAPSAASLFQATFSLLSVGGATIVRAAAGAAASVFVTDTGLVYACGLHFGAVYTGTAVSQQNTPALVSAGLGSATIVDVSAGHDHVLLLDSNGQVYGWGRNAEGQAGAALSVASVASPTPVAALVGVKVVGIAAGGFHSLALSDAGHVWAFGRNSDGQCGRPLSSRVVSPPVQLSEALFGSTVAQHVSAGPFHSIISSVKGQVYAMGWNYNSVLDVGVTANTPLLLAGVTSDITQSYAGGDVVVSLTRSSIVPCPYACHGHGGCIAGNCVCPTLAGGGYWTGTACEIPVCGADAAGRPCAGNGTCVVQNDVPVCACRAGFTGPTCELADCALERHSCYGRGTCEFGLRMLPVCRCNLGWGAETNCSSCARGLVGPLCDTIDCVGGFNNCTNRGMCVPDDLTGGVKCDCNKNWGGLECAALACTDSCSGHGTCALPLPGEIVPVWGTNSTMVTDGTPLCRCHPQWTGELCEVETCLGSPICSGRGNCTRGSGSRPVCACEAEWSTADCSAPLCLTLDQCSGHGTCIATRVDGKPVASCRCQDSWGGANCSEASSSTRTNLLIGLLVGGILVGLALGGFFCWGVWKRHSRSVGATGGTAGGGNFGGFKKRKKAFSNVSGIV